MNVWHYLLLWWHDRRMDKLNEGYDYQPATPELTATRFKQLFNLHGVEVAEIPEIKGFESITLYDLNSNDRLLQKLTPEFLHKTADTFGVRVEWLRSGDPVLYQHRHWYKGGLPNFFDDLKEVDFDETFDPFFVVTTAEKFDVNSPDYQPFILVLRKHLAEIVDKDLYKYYFDSVWDWHHPPCRLQAKGLATKYYELTGRLITIYQTNQEIFHKIQEGYIPPCAELSMNHKISFEEYGALKLPHMEPYEKHEWDAIREEMKYYKIDGIQYEYVKKPKPTATECEQPATKAKSGRKPSKEKRELKNRFVFEYESKIESNQISCAQAARDFYNSLNTEDEKLLFRSDQDYQKSTSDELREKAERTLTEYYRQYKANKCSTVNSNNI